MRGGAGLTPATTPKHRFAQVPDSWAAGDDAVDCRQEVPDQTSPPPVIIDHESSGVAHRPTREGSLGGEATDPLGPRQVGGIDPSSRIVAMNVVLPGKATADSEVVVRPIRGKALLAADAGRETIASRSSTG